MKRLVFCGDFTIEMKPVSPSSAVSACVGDRLLSWYLGYLVADCLLAGV